MEAMPQVEGPAWTGRGLDMGAGRYPLQVERVVGRLVGRLLPGIITTTRHARMYSIHALAWADAEERGLDPEAAAELVRRCEVVAAAIYRHHTPHRVRLASAAHGEARIDQFTANGAFRVAEAAAPRHGLSQIGFRDVYVGPAAQVGLLTPGDPPRSGIRADVGELRTALGDLLALAERDEVPVEELAAAGHLCLCAVATAADGELLRDVFFARPDPQRVEDRCRQLSAHMLLRTIAAEPDVDPEAAFCADWGFGDPLDRLAGNRVAAVACGWRAAILRNYSVGAWRSLWRWLAEQLKREPMTVEQLGDVLADALGDLSVQRFIGELPSRAEGGRVLPAEAELAAAEPDAPLTSLRLLALGAQRLDDLDDTTRRLFLGSVPHDLGPVWMGQRLREWHHDHLSQVARELTEILVRRAQRVALDRMRLEGGMPRIRTRLRDRDGLLSVHGEEGAGEVALRLGSLTEILIALGSLDRRPDGVVEVTAAGRELLERTA